MQLLIESHIWNHWIYGPIYNADRLDYVQTMRRRS